MRALVRSNNALHEVSFGLLTSAQKEVKEGKRESA